MKFIKIMIVLIGIFCLGFPQVAIAKKDHVPGRPFAFLFDLIKQFGNNKSAPGIEGPPGPAGPQGEAGPQGSAGILEKYVKVHKVMPYRTSGSFIVYCDNIPDDVAISANAYTYIATPGGAELQGTPYNDVLRPVCTYYGEDDPEPGLETMTCQSDKLPIGWQFIQHPNNNRYDAHVVLNVTCIFAPDAQ